MRRIATGLILAGTLVPAIFFLPRPALFWLWLLVTELAMLELSELLEKMSPGGLYRWLLLLHPILVLALLTTLERATAFVPLVGFLVVFAASVLAVCGRGGVDRMATTAGLSTYALFYLAIPVLALEGLFDLDRWIVFLVVAVVAVGDIAAYYVGSRLGKRRLAPAISPKKTWEGAVASLGAAMVVGVLFSWWRLGRVDWILIFWVGAASVSGQFGDLVESTFKRAAGVKDSGTWLPGHGGILDRLDGLLFAVPVFCLGALTVAPERWLP